MNIILYYSRLPLVLIFVLFQALSFEAMAQNQSTNSYAKNIILQDAESAILTHDWSKIDESMDAVDSMIVSNDTISELQKILLYAQLHIEIGNFTKAKEELDTALKMLEGKEVLNTLQIELLTKANLIYSRLNILENRTDEATKILNKSKDLLTTAVNDLYYNLIEYEEAKIALHEKDYFTALQKLEKSLIYFEKNNNHFYLTQCLNYIAEAYLGLEEVNEAEKFALSALNNAQTFNVEINAMYSYKILSDIYKAKDQPAFALSNLELFNAAKNRLNNRQNILNTEDKFAQKILEDKNQTIRELNAYVKQLELIQRKKNMTYVLMLGMISILGLFSFFLYKNYTFRNRTNKALIEKNIQLTKERDQAQDANKIKSEFISSITHELRTPMYAVIGITHLMLENNPDKEQREHLITLKNSGDYLLTLINNILDFNKLEANKVDLDIIPFVLKRRLVEIIRTLQPQIDDKENKIHLDFDENISSRVNGDPMKISQVLINLISNANKFTKKGDIYVRVKQVDKNRQFTKVRFEVEDTGIGISEENQDKIFETFTQETKGTTREFGGTGLGLSIAKNLIELMGGEIKLESHIGKGTKFFFEISFDNRIRKPLEITNSFKEDVILSDRRNERQEPSSIRDTPSNPTSESFDQPENKVQKPSSNAATESDNSNEELNKVIATKPANQEQLNRKKILIVEDNKVNQMITKKILEQKNIQSDTVNSGEEAVKHIEENPDYDLVLMDIHMPGISGFEATKRIRAFNTEIPIIALTAVVISENIDEFYEAGFDDVIPKPYVVKDFFNKIYKAFENYEVL